MAVMALVAAFVAAGNFMVAAHDDTPVVVTADVPASNPAMATVRVKGLSSRLLNRLSKEQPSLDQWQSVFAVYVGDNLPTIELPPVLGIYTIDNGELVFTPRFPFATGLRFYAFFDRRAADALVGEARSGTPDGILETTFVIPQPETNPTTIVRAIYPTSDTLPANQLRLYIHFSAPMNGRNIDTHISLVDSDNHEVSEAFVETDLWDPDRQRLTLLFHPGRIKRGLAYHERSGPPLHKGARYHLRVDSAALDANGHPLVASFEKTFTVIAADRTSPNPNLWIVTSPPAASTAPVTVEFGEPLDHALLARFLTIQDAHGGSVAGRIEVSAGETVWEYHPESHWKPGRYRIVVDNALEDLAGNRLDALFDEESGDEARSNEHSPRIHLNFDIGK